MPPGRPPIDPALIAEALALCAGGLSPQQASEQLKAQGKVVSWRSIYTARAKAQQAQAGAELTKLAPSPAYPAPPAPVTSAPFQASPSGLPGVAYRPGKRSVGGPGAVPRVMPPGPGPDDDDEQGGEIDAEGTPLEVTRALLAKATAALHKLAPDSPRRNPAATECRNLTKLVAALEKQAGEKETPESIERRRRQDDAETRKEIEQYTLQAEARAAEPRPGAPHGVCVTCGSPRAEASPA